jgi:MerR family transcriptional regulator, light-induced transcriptional regulator
MSASVAISAVERDTGLSKDTLRVWERRYNFPQPLRDAFGERLYPADQVEKLRAIKRLLDRGLRPGKIMHHSLDELMQLGRAAQDTAAPGGATPGNAASNSATAPTPSVASSATFEDHHATSADLRRMVDLIRTHRVDELRRAMGQAVLKDGLAHFVTALVVPLNAMVGDAWINGQLEVFEEHLYTEALQGVLRSAIATVPRDTGSPRVLLTTLPLEEHGLGLLMAEALLTLEGAYCISLGVETPVADIVRAAASQRADIVALSFSAAYPATMVRGGLEELRAALPPHTALWAGGASTAALRRVPDGVTILNALNSIHTTLTQWRAQRLDA